jgi:hypothetical protein
VPGPGFKINCPTRGLRLIYLAEADGSMFLLCAEHGTVAARPSGRVEVIETGTRPKASDTQESL